MKKPTFRKKSLQVLRAWVKHQMSVRQLSVLPAGRPTRRVVSAGDTIVEVIIVTAILALVLAGSYSLTNHALQNGIDANRRTEALSFAQRQIEYIKDAYKNKTGFLGSYQSSPDFCIDTDTPSGLGPILFNQPNSACQNYHNSAISVDVQYAGSSQTFTVTSSWDAANGNQDQLQLYYLTAS